MKKTMRIAVTGGDRRQDLLAELLAADGHETQLIHAAEDLYFLDGADLTVFPLPACRDDGTVTDAGLTASELFLHMPHGSVAAGGRIPPSFYGMAELRGVTLHDYTKREDFAIANALATAEGALGIAIMQMDVTLQGAACLVVGNGRIGKLLARKLALLGADVTVSARRADDLTWVKTDGHAAVHTAAVADVAGRFDVIFNTVPVMVLDVPVLEKTRPGALIIDLASKPGGVDFDAAQALGRRTVWALSLPAKTAPRSAAAYVRDSLYHIMEECK